MSSHPQDFYTSLVFGSAYPHAQPLTSFRTPEKVESQLYHRPYYGGRHAAVQPSEIHSRAQPYPSPIRPPTPQSLPPQAVPPNAGRLPASLSTFDAPKQGGRKYTHNPYASTVTALSPCLPPSPTTEMGPYGTPFLSATPVRSGNANSQGCPGGSHFPVYATSDGVYGEASSVAATVDAQFWGMVGNIANSALTAPGRHLLMSVLRLRHLDIVDAVFQEIAPEFNTVAMDPNGCHVVRTLIEYISTAQMEALVPYMNAYTIRQLATATQHTRRVLQAIFEHHKSDALLPIVRMVKEDCQRLSVTQQGCIAIIRIIEYATPAPKRELIDALVPILSTLAKNEFGNYVVQCILKNIEGYVSLRGLEKAFKGHWVELSCDKYSSNVMEKMVGILKGEARQRVLREVIFDETNLQRLLQNSFGNYVLQAIIGTAADTNEFVRIRDAIAPFLHTSPYGHRIEAKLKSRCDALCEMYIQMNNTVAVDVQPSPPL